MKYIETVKRMVLEYTLIKPGEHVGVAVSGGSDSVYLLYVLNALKEVLDFKITVLHVEHGIRGAASKRDMSFVMRCCDALGLPVITKSVDTKPYAKSMGYSLEQAGRELRYDFFEKIAAKEKLDKIALAHHLNDQAETVLFNLVRGCGMQGLLGIQPFRPPLYIRPLLKLEKAEIINALKAEGLTYRQDSTNKNRYYARNRMRHAVMPELKKINPQAERNIVKTVQTLLAEDGFLRKQAQTEYEKRVRTEDGEVHLRLENWEAVDTAIQRRMIRQMLDDYFSLIDVEFIHIEGIINISLSGNGKKTDGLGEVMVAKAYDRLVFFKVENQSLSPITIVVGQDTTLDYAGYRFSMTWQNEIDLAKNAECLNGEKLEGLVLRTPQPDDYIIPLGMKGKKRLSDYLSDRRVPLHLRKNWPVFCIGDAVMMVTAVGMSDAAKVDEQTKSICRIQFDKKVITNFINEV